MTVNGPIEILDSLRKRTEYVPGEQVSFKLARPAPFRTPSRVVQIDCSVTTRNAKAFEVRASAIARFSGVPKGY